MIIVRRLQITLIHCLLAAVCVGCAAGPVRYQPEDANGYGYRDMPLGNSTYRITFVGNGLTRAETVDRYALYRAAELTLERGKTHFAVVRDDGTASYYSSSGSQVSSTASTSHTPPFGAILGRTTAEASTSMSSYSSSSTSHTGILTIMLLDGPGTGLIYDAREISTSMKEELAKDNKRIDEAVASTNSWMTMQYLFLGVGTIIFIILAASV